MLERLLEPVEKLGRLPEPVEKLGRLPELPNEPELRFGIGELNEPERLLPWPWLKRLLPKLGVLPDGD